MRVRIKRLNMVGTRRKIRVRYVRVCISMIAKKRCQESQKQYEPVLMEVNLLKIKIKLW